VAEHIVLAIAGRPRPQSVLSYHGSPDRGGMGCDDRAATLPVLAGVGDRLYAGTDGRIYAFSF
jgi:hypothetical protein